MKEFMDNVRLKLEIEIENIDSVIQILLEQLGKKDRSKLELAGIATYIHNFYNGIENILKQILKTKNISIEGSAYWHKELLEKAIKHKLISENLAEILSEFMSFRHFFVHSYSFILNEKKLDQLHKKVFNTYEEFKKEIQPFIVH
ncbi:MAG: hypothetical protein JXN63_00765 [Candidatus Delongbacteria bacterium]|nr:hypothetical protein [Candidatus Delongbacteria bacterium]